MQKNILGENISKYKRFIQNESLSNCQQICHIDVFIASGIEKENNGGEIKKVYQRSDLNLNSYYVLPDLKSSLLLNYEKINQQMNIY